MRHLSAIMLLTFASALVGCAPTAPPNKAPVAKPADKHDHDHAHHHHGPHDGHMAEVGKEEYHLEWTHTDEPAKVTIYVLDGEAKKDVPASNSELVVVTKTGDKEEEFTLVAVDAKEGKANKFELADAEFLGRIEGLGKAVTATIKSLEIDGKKFENVKLEEHEHGHDH